MRVKIDGEYKDCRTVWMKNGTVFMIDQIKLPYSFKIYESLSHKTTAEAIKSMLIRGAGAIGIAAGYGMAQGILEASENNFLNYIKNVEKILKSTRPTAVNLFHAVDDVLAAIKDATVDDAKRIAVERAQQLAEESVLACRKIGEYGEKLIENGYKIMTHCNAGWLAFVDWGTATAPMYVAKRNGKQFFVYADETRPRNQGARLTAWELNQEDIDHRIIPDNAAGHFMRKGNVDMVIVGADRIARNGDVANKIGTYEKAVLAKENGIPFYVAAPVSTIDFDCKSGDKIPIEERSEDEVLYIEGPNDSGDIEKVRIASFGSKAFNPAFDVTPARYVTGIITEKGIIEPKKVRDLIP